MTSRSSQLRPARPGFTMIEILVVIGIIVILLGIGVAVMKKVNDQAIAKQTQILLTDLRSVATEYSIAANRLIDPRDGGMPFSGSAAGWTSLNDPTVSAFLKTGTGNTTSEANRVTAAQVWSARFCWAASRVPAAKKRLQAIPLKYFWVYSSQTKTGSAASDTTFLGQCLDNPHQPKPISTGDTSEYTPYLVDPFGNAIAFCSKTTTTATSVPTSEATSFLPAYTGMFFASAGPNGKWGHQVDLLKRQANLGYDRTNATQAEDNVFSFNFE